MFRKSLLILLLLTSAYGCQIDRTTSHPGDHVWQRTELYFGRNTNLGGQVSDQEWNTFVEREITSRFPAGSTVVDTHGQWTGPDGKLVREDSRVLILLHDNDSETDRKIEAIRKAYIQQHHQDAVMRVDSTSRVSF